MKFEEMELRIESCELVITKGKCKKWIRELRSESYNHKYDRPIDRPGGPEPPQQQVESVGMWATISPTTTLPAHALLSSVM